MAEKITIIGGGAAGCMADITASEYSGAVTLIEKNPAPAKKILSTGNGRCNYCHETVNFEDFYRSSGDGFLSEVFNACSPRDVIDSFKRSGITPLNKDGYIYPYSEQAKAVAEVLRRKVRNSSVVMTDTCVTDIYRKNGKFNIICEDKELTSDRVIIACGGAAAPFTGSDGKGFELCRALGHRIIPPTPGLTFMDIKDHPFRSAAGIRLSAEVTIETDGAFRHSDSGQIQITKTGISGIPAFNVSRFASRALFEKKEAFLHIRLVPDMEKEELSAEIERRFCSSATPYEGLIGLFPDSFADSLLRYAGIHPDRFEKDKEKAARKLSETAFDIKLKVISTGTMKDAQVTCGGVSTDEVDPLTMGSKIVPGLYLAGEILDIDAKCGGYNLYFAWASGFIAGRSAASFG